MQPRFQFSPQPHSRGVSKWGLAVSWVLSPDKMVKTTSKWFFGFILLSQTQGELGCCVSLVPGFSVPLDFKEHWLVCITDQCS